MHSIVSVLYCTKFYQTSVLPILLLDYTIYMSTVCEPWKFCLINHQLIKQLTEYILSVGKTLDLYFYGASMFSYGTAIILYGALWYIYCTWYFCSTYVR